MVCVRAARRCLLVSRHMAPTASSAHVPALPVVSSLLLVIASACYLIWRRRSGRESTLFGGVATARPARVTDTAAGTALLPFLAPSESADDVAAAEHERAEEAELLTEQLSRNRAYLGDAGQARVEGACVVVLGVGGVGSHVAQLLGRTGVRRLRLIDPGRVTERSLESHAVATRADLGAHKGAVLRSVLSRVLPACCVEVVTEQITQENAAALLFGAAAVGGGSSHGGGEGGGASADGSVCNGSRAASCGVDMVVACLPSAPGEPSHTLAAALAACLAARVRCVPVVYASDEPPAAVVRQRFSSLHDVCGSVAARRLVSHTRRLVPHAPPMAAASLLAVHAGETSSIRTHRPGAPTATELAACTGKCTDGSAGIARTDGARAASSMRHGKSSLTDADGTGSKADGSGSGNAGGSARFDASSLSLRGALRAGMGHAAASACLCELAGCALTPSVGLFTKTNREDAHKALLRREREVFGATTPPDVWPEDLEYLATEVWGGVCVASGGCIGGGGAALVFTRWDRTCPAAVDNLVLLTKQEAEKHDQASDPMARWEPELAAAVGRALEQAGNERSAWATSP